MGSTSDRLALRPRRQAGSAWPAMIEQGALHPTKRDIGAATGGAGSTADMPPPPRRPSWPGCQDAGEMRRPSDGRDTSAAGGRTD